MGFLVWLPVLVSLGVAPAAVTQAMASDPGSDGAGIVKVSHHQCIRKVIVVLCQASESAAVLQSYMPPDGSDGRRRRWRRSPVGGTW